LDIVNKKRLFLPFLKAEVNQQYHLIKKYTGCHSKACPISDKCVV